MPKRPKFIHPVRAVRGVIAERVPSMNQQVFADLVGLSKSMVNAIECGARPITKPSALLIASATGAKADSLMSKHDKPLNELGAPYSFSDYENSIRPLGGHELATRMVDLVQPVALLTCKIRTMGMYQMVRLHFHFWLAEVLGILESRAAKGTSATRSRGRKRPSNLEDLYGLLEKNLGELAPRPPK